jgi:hypothetical protein
MIYQNIGFVQELDADTKGLKSSIRAATFGLSDKVCHVWSGTTVKKQVDSRKFFDYVNKELQEKKGLEIYQLPAETFQYILICLQYLGFSNSNNENILPMTILEHECWDKSITYLRVDENWIIYYKKGYSTSNIEMYAYNVHTRSQYCYSPRGNEIDVKISIMNQIPYAIITDFDTTTLKCMAQGNETFRCEVPFSVEDITFGNIIISQEFKVDIMDNVVSLYQYPEMTLLKETNGVYGQIFRHNNNLVCTII